MSATHQSFIFRCTKICTTNVIKHCWIHILCHIKLNTRWLWVWLTRRFTLKVLQNMIGNDCHRYVSPTSLGCSFEWISWNCSPHNSFTNQILKLNTYSCFPSKHFEEKIQFEHVVYASNEPSLHCLLKSWMHNHLSLSWGYSSLILRLHTRSNRLVLD